MANDYQDLESLLLLGTYSIADSPVGVRQNLQSGGHGLWVISDDSIYTTRRAHEALLAPKRKLIRIHEIEHV